jgi:subtilase family serine protease
VRPRVVEAVDDARRTTLNANVHPLARAEFDRGAVAESQPMNRILLLLKRSDEQEAALQDMLAKQQDKSSAIFHQWLTPEQFGAQFGPADADIQAVTDWLTRQGFSIGKIYSGKTVIEFSGTAGQVQRAFGTTIHNYQVNGKLYSANSSDPQIPAALAPVVTGVVSLHNFLRQFYSQRVGNLRRSAGKSVLEPLTTIPNPFGPGNFYGLGPGDFAKIYGVPATCGSGAAVCSGSGQTVAIVGETDINVADVQQFRAAFGLPATFSTSNVIYNGENPGITSTGEEGEADLDTQWSGGVAPGATVEYVVSASTSASQGVDLSALYIVEHNLAGVMSESYGDCEANLGTAENSFVNNLWEQASAQGITVAVSTGDSGSAGCDNPHLEGLATHQAAVNGLASTPYNVAVGGTDFDEYNNWTTYWNATNDPTTQTSAKGYIPEIPWNQSCAQLGASGCNINTTPVQLQNIVAGGGGPSSRYSKPSWQLGIAGGPNDGHRDLPDISLMASPGFNGTGYLYCQTDVANAGATPCGQMEAGQLVYQVVGGTSVSAPAFAGIMALVNQSQATSQNPAPRQGNANYVLYALANKPGVSCTSSVTEATGCVFNDVTKGSSALPTGGGPALVATNSVPCTSQVIDCSASVSGQIGVLVVSNGSPTEAWIAGTGYDMATGLGSLNVGNLVSTWGTVSTVPTTTTLNLNPTTGIPHGSENVTATIGVTPKTGTATGTVSLIALIPAPTGTGTVPFGAGEFTLGSKGSVTGTAQNLPGGANYQVYAHYSGDGTNSPSDSTPVMVSVASEGSETFIVVPTFDLTSGNETNPNASSVTYGSSYIVRMYVTNIAGTASLTGAPTGACTQASTVACPSGTVSLTANGNAVDGGTFRLNSIGYTRDISPTLPGGTYPLAATYSGDSSYQSSKTSETFTVNPAPTTLNAPITDGSTSLVGQQAFLAASLTTLAFTGVAPTGTVTFYDGGPALTSPVTLTPTAPAGSTPGGLSAQTLATFTTTGTHTITAKYSGDGNYMAATSSGSATVDAVYQTAMSLNAPTSSLNFGQSLTLTAVITSQGKNPQITGQVQFTGPFQTLTNVMTTPGTDSSGNQMLTVTATTVPQGPGFFYASYPGDTNFLYANSAPVYVNVNIPDFTLGPQAGLSVVPVAGQSGSGSITITPMGQTPSTVSLTFSPLVISGYNITLSPQQVNLNGAPVMATLSLTPVGSSPTNAVRSQTRHAEFFVPGDSSWWSGSFAASLAIVLLLALPGRQRKLRSALGLGVAALFLLALGCGGGGGSGGGGRGGGGGGGGGGGTNPQPTSITLTTTNAKVGQNVQFQITATITSTSGKPLTGTVNFYNFGAPVNGGIPPSNGQASTGSGWLNNPGLYQITAQYTGDANNLASTSAPLTQVITGTMPVTIQGSTGVDVHLLQVTLGLQ